MSNNFWNYNRLLKRKHNSSKNSVHNVNKSQNEFPSSLNQKDVESFNQNKNKNVRILLFFLTFEWVSGCTTTTPQKKMWEIYMKNHKSTNKTEAKNRSQNSLKQRPKCGAKVSFFDVASLFLLPLWIGKKMVNQRLKYSESFLIWMEEVIIDLLLECFDLDD